MTPVRFLPAAELELLREVAYYSKAPNGTGMRFQAAAEAAVALAARHPLGGAPSFMETRSVLVKGFPFSIVYRPLGPGIADRRRGTAPQRSRLLGHAHHRMRTPC